MSEEPIQHRQGSSRHMALILGILMLLLAVYVLSPPWVERAFGLQVNESNWYQIVYGPLIALAEESPTVRQFYIWYFEMCDM